MSLSRFRWLVSTFAVWAACSGDGPPAVTPDPTDTYVADTSAPTDTVVPADTAVAPDSAPPIDSVQPPDTTPPAGTLAFSVETAAGARDDASFALYPEDELASYSGQAHPGFQADLTVATTSVAAGEPAALLIDGVVIAVRQVTVDDDGAGHARFDAVTLPSGAANLRITVTDARGDTLTADKAIEVVDTPCTITVTDAVPTTCYVADADADVDGFQAPLTITRTGGDCASVVLGASYDGVAWTGLPIAFDGSDVLTASATLGDAARGMEGPVVITASATHAHSIALGSVVRLERMLDARSPAPRFVQPDPALALRVTLAQDADQDPTNGIQYDLLVAGGAPDVADVSLSVDGQPLAAGNAIGGTWTWPAHTFALDGHSQIVAMATDACGNTGTVSVGLDVYATQPTVALVAPADGAILLARDDGDRATASQYELTFLVDATNVKAGSDLIVNCRADASSAPVRITHHAFATDAAVAQLSLLGALNVDLLGKTPSCSARIDGYNPVFSPNHSIVIALPGPAVALTEPAEGARLNTRDFVVSGYAENLEGRPIHVTVSDAAGAIVYDADAGLVANGAFALQLGGEAPFADGAYTLAIDAIDAYGNVASHLAAAPSHSFTLDATPPSVVRVWPTSDVLDPIADSSALDVAPETPGYQTWLTWRMDGETLADGATLCPTVAGSALPCKAPEADTFAAVWTVTLASGTSPISIVARDAWGNASAPSVDAITLLLDAPAVTITTPVQGLVTAADSVDVDVHVAEPTAQAPIDGADVRLYADGAFVDLAAVALGNGDYRFVAVPLAAGATIDLQAIAAFSGEEGASAERSVRQKDVVPTVAITSPDAGSVFNRASLACGGTQQNCVTTIALAVSELESGSPVALDVQCGSDHAVVRATATGGGAVAFSAVTLIHGAPCTVGAQVTDAAGQIADAAPITVRVDRVAPSVLAFVKPAGDTLTHINDQKPGTPGMQAELRLSLAGVEAGQLVTAAMAWTDIEGAPATMNLSHTVATTTPDSGSYLAVFSDPEIGQGLIQYPEGLVTLNITLADAAGNPSSAARSVFVQTDRPAARITAPAWLGDATCSATVPCATGICHEGMCWRGWGLDESTVLVLDVAGLMTASANLRVCSDAASLAGSAPDCTSAGYRQVALTDAVNGVAVIDLGGLPEAPQRLIAEVLPQDGGEWVTSLDADVESARRRHIFVDMTPPAITAISSPSDDVVPLGMLNAAEQDAPNRTFAVTVSANEDGPVTVFANGQLAASDAIASGTATLSLQLAEGANTVYARVSDRVGNISAAASVPGLVTWTPTVDTVAPTLAFTAPAASPIAAGANRDVVLLSNEQGAAVMVSDAGVEVANGAVIGGAARFDHATHGLLSDGSHTLTASVADAAGNTTHAATTPATILVDTTPPTVTLTAPADLLALTAADDPNPATPAVELDLVFVPADGATSWSIKTANCDQSWICGNAAATATGSVDVPGDAITQTVALSPAAAISHYRLDVIVADSVGNRTTVSTRVTLIVQDCVVTLAGFGTGGYLGSADCGPGGGCPVTVTGSAAGSNCAEVDGLALVQRTSEGDVILGESYALVSGSAQFTTQAQDGDAMSLFIQARVGDIVVADSAVATRVVDLVAPTVVATPIYAGTAPAAGLLNASNDYAVAAGYQISVAIEASDANLSGGAIERIVRSVAEAEVEQTATNFALPYALDNALVSTVAQHITLLDLAQNVVRVEVSDAAGNIGSATFTLAVDATPPAAVALAPIDPDEVDRHRPAVTLRWLAVGEDGGTGAAAAGYDVRYSRLPITDSASFEGACQVASMAHAAALPTPAAAGVSESLVVGGPDTRSLSDACKLAASNTPTAWYFAVRAQDDAGNWGPVEATSQASTTQLVWTVTRVRYSTAFATAAGLSATAVKYLGGVGANVGDVNGDGFADVVHGFFMSNAFCLVYGGNLAAELTLDTVSGPNHRCVVGAINVVGDATAKELGSFVDALGDVNGDGYADFGVSGKTGGVDGFVAVYLGAQGGANLSAPAVIVRGIDGLTAAYAGFCGAGPFNGAVAPAIDDIAVGEPASDRLRVIPGSQSWTPGQATVVINLDAADVATTFGIQTFTAQFGEVAWFGNRCQRAGDLLPTPGGARAAGDLLVQQAKNEDSRVIVIPGRPLAAGTTSILTKLDGVLTDEDLVAVRLRQDPTPTGAFVNGFGSSFQGGVDLTGDGVPDVVVGHTGRSTTVAGQDGKAVFIFDGQAILAAQGAALRVTSAGATPVNNAWLGANGTVLKADVSGEFRAVTHIGNYSGWAWGGVETVDLAIANKIGASVQVRYNVETEAGPAVLGLSPYTEGNLVHPTATGMFSAGMWVDAGGDLDGDGALDFLVGTGNDGILIVH